MSALRMVRAEDLEEARLAEVDREFMTDFGPDWASWLPWQQEQYLTAIERVHAEFAPQGVAA
ncbi:hypothetical protein [Streptomyces sp. SCL15-4]|uniref:hypothetical protein n=1 Tax=Streptomyces sp. SCL15-4 TaxID=2967221 RepID=UPI00296711C6|nr:hypothetical protein [Streptomyces sp. SCL15-4]